MIFISQNSQAVLDGKTISNESKSLLLRSTALNVSANFFEDALMASKTTTLDYRLCGDNRQK